jgi:hypothetical protein
VPAAPALRPPRPRRRAPRDPARPRPPERRPAFALERLRENALLRGCAALTFLQYGALLAVLVSGGLQFWMVGTLAFFSLCSWFFLFRWYPFLETMIRPSPGGGTRATLGQVFETLAILCVAFVHVMLLLVLGSRLQ